MACQEFTVLYTHQKTKKSKVWQDGILKSTVGGNKAVLCDVKGQVLDSIFVKFQVKSGDDLESERYLITVEAEKNSGIDGDNILPKNTEVPMLTTNNLRIRASSLHVPVGLKRKFTGFQGPRHVEKKMATVKEPVATASPKCPESSFPSQFYVCSPLFSAPYQKKEEANLLPVFKGDALMSSSTESITSVSFMPYPDHHKVVQNVSYCTGSADPEHLKPESHLDNGLVNLNYNAMNSVAVSQNIRSKGQIIELLKSKTPLFSTEQKHSMSPECERASTLNNLPLTTSQFPPESLPLSEPSRSTDFLIQQKMSPVLGSVNSTKKESTEHIQGVPSTAKNVQTKSRWDAYLPSHVSEEPPDLNDTGHNDKLVSDLQPVIKDLKEGGDDTRNQYKVDTNIPQIPSSLGISSSPISKTFVTKQPHSSIVIESCMNIGNKSEVVLLEALDANLSKSNEYPVAANLEAFCHQSQNEPCSVISSENFSDGELGDPAKQFIQVNFDVLDIQDFSDTEDGECHADSVLSQQLARLKAEREVSVEKISEEKACITEGKDSMQSAFLQGSNMNCTSQSCDKMFEDAKKYVAKCNFRSEYSEATFVDDIVGSNAIGAENSDTHTGLDYIGRNWLMVNDVGCGMNKKCPTQTSHLQTKVISYVHPHSNISFMDKNNKGIEAGRNNSQLPSVHICDDMALVSPILTVEESNSSSDGFPQYIANKHDAAPESSYDRPRAHPLDCEPFSDETQMCKEELEDIIGPPEAFNEFIEENEKNSSASSLPKLTNGFCLLRSLTEHSTALESLQMIEESPGLSYQRGTLTEKHISKEGPGARQHFAEVSYSENVTMSSCSDASKTHCSLSNHVEKPAAAVAKMLHGRSPTGVAESQSKPVAFQGYQLKGSAASEVMTRETCSHLRWDPYADLAESESMARDDCFFSDQELSSPVLPGFFKMLPTQESPSCPSECHFFSSPSSIDPTADMKEQEFLLSRIFPLPTNNTKSFSRMKESICSVDDSVHTGLPTHRKQTPVVTLPVDEVLPDSEVYSSLMACEQMSPFGFPVVNMYNKSKMLGPEDRMCESVVDEKRLGERQEVLIQSAFPNVSEQKRQSKWQKYQNTTHCDLGTPNSSEVVMTDDFEAENVLGMPLDDTGEGQNDAVNKSPPDFAHLQMIKSMLCKQHRNFSSQDSVSEKKQRSVHLSPIFSTEEAPKVLGQLNHNNRSRHAKNVSELFFPSADIVNCTDLPKRQMCIPAEFQSSALYKQVFTAALIEHLNILLFELSQRLHKALGKVDISFCTSAKGGQVQENSAPLCNHKIAAKLVMVKKEGRNKGRLFYACDAPKAERCDFFKWLDDVNPGQFKSTPSVAFHDLKSIGTYLRSQNIFLHEECQLLVRKAFDIQRKRFSKLKKFNIANAEFDCDGRNKLYLKLSRKEHSSMYSKDDLWVVSKTLTFEPLDTFIACSVFFGPSSNSEIELEPLKGYSPSNWHSNMIVHALLVCNASTELTTLRNIEENFSSAALPIMQHLLTRPFKEVSGSNKINKRKFKPPVLNTNTMTCGLLSPEMTISLANKMIQTFRLNKDQAMALLQIGNMMASYPIDKETGKQQPLPITIIHGVFGSGKSYLLAIVILFLVQIFETSEAAVGKRLAPWKILISSSTNVAVDRVLLCLLDLGFEEFIRVGSIRKIAKPVLPYSLHAGLGSESEQLKELLALMKEDLTPAEKNYVRKTIEHHRLGTNKALLQQVKVVGATCAACPFPCMKNLKFPVVVLDECSQMTEPASLLPIARFGCEKLILVGDPKQLPPTIQGSESARDNGLEQTLFDRLRLMGHEPVLLRTQYRCHPAISAISNNLFYDGDLLDGISEMDRNPLVDWLPTLCFYNVNGSEQMERDNSFHNMAESFFTVKLIQSLIASGTEGSMIGVITLYKSQMSKICNLLAAVDSDASQIKAVQVSTVDAFQGAEKEIIVLSCVRTRQVGFIDSETRVNVALTRGKRHLLIVGNLNCLRKSKLWESVIQHCAGSKDGLQHVSQCEQKLNDILKSYMERKKEEERKQKEKSRSKSLSQRTDV
ncbi:PREDICTED: protein ZGRF1 [Gekko japonicus]|uniref:Protein ZGRF1 n=1 Tax=Gekko japonicus TaxID=146911 RepID=A0ABM1K0X5_GEKJA|nr:PREDICTED: protein ZGRF1 [Gekko japonicus]